MNSSSSSLPLPHWKAQLQKALHRHRSQPEARYVQLATVDLQGYPRNRTVVFRGFFNDTDQLQFAVDQRSEKVSQLQQRPQAEVCWYFAKTREQFRLSGVMTLVQDPQDISQDLQTARSHLWDQLSDQSRLLWYWPTPKADQASAADYKVEIPKAATPPPTFVLLVFTPYQVDHLQLKGDLNYPQIRHLYHQQDATWVRRSVNP